VIWQHRPPRVTSCEIGHTSHLRWEQSRRRAISFAHDSGPRCSLPALWNSALGLKLPETLRCFLRVSRGLISHATDSTVCFPFQSPEVITRLFMLVITTFHLARFAAVSDMTHWTVVMTLSSEFEHSYPQKWRTQSVSQPKALGRYALMLKFQLRMFNACRASLVLMPFKGPKHYFAKQHENLNSYNLIISPNLMFWQLCLRRAFFLLGCDAT
jgi:hypothetical protein